MSVPADADVVNVEVLEARELIPMDRNGFSDPFIVVTPSPPAANAHRGAPKKWTTKTARKTLSPTWNESFIVPVGRPPPSDSSHRGRAGDLVVECWDYDMFKKNDRMGSVCIPLDSLLPCNTTKDEWFALKPTRDGDPVSGALHLRLTRFLVGGACVGCSSPPPAMGAEGGVASGGSARENGLGELAKRLFVAVERGDLFELMTVMRIPGCDLNACDAQMETPLHRACANSENEHVLLTLLNHKDVAANAVNVDGNTPLHIFAKCFKNPNVGKCLDLLLERGANVNAQNKAGETPLHRTVFNPAIMSMLVELLVKKGANIEARTSKQMTTLHYAVRMGRADLLPLLVSKGANLEARDDKGKTAREMAVEVQDPLAIQRVNQCWELLGYLQKAAEVAVPGDAERRKRVFGVLREKFFEKKLWLHRIRTAVTDTVLEEMGVTDPQDRKGLLQQFAGITAVDPMLATITPSAGAHSISQTPQTLRQQVDQRKSTNVLIPPSELEFSKLLGEGSAGKVYAGMYKGTVPVAVKILEDAAATTEFFKEVDIIMALTRKSPYIVGLHGILWDGSEGGKLGMVMELCERGSLYHVLMDDSLDLTWRLTLSFMEQAAAGLNALHKNEKPIFHRDLKSLNLLVTKDYQVKLADFGLSRLNTADNLQTLQRIRGTYAYIAPEVLNCQMFTDKCDVYSLGIIFWEIVYRCINKRHQRPYAEFPDIKMDYQVIFKVAKENVRPTIPPSTPPSMRNLIQLCVMKDAENRPTCEAIVGHLAVINETYRSNPSEWDSCILGLS